MRFIIRGVRSEDEGTLFQLAQQFPLLNLPSDKKAIQEKIEISRASFQGALEKTKSLYLFVAEDLKNNSIVGCSQIIGKHGTPENPTYSFQIHKKERFSKSSMWALSIGSYE